MSHGIRCNPGEGGDLVNAYDLDNPQAYAATGKVPSNALLVFPDLNTPPAPVTPANPLPVEASALPLPAGAASETTLAALRDKIGAGNALGDVGLVPSTSGGLTAYSLVSAATANLTAVKAAPGQLYGFAFYNTNPTNFRFVKVYDKATAPNPATDVPVLQIAVPPEGGLNVIGALGTRLANGLAFAVVGGAAQTDATAVGANEVLVNLFYK